MFDRSPLWSHLVLDFCLLGVLLVFLNLNLFIYLFMAVLGLRFCARAFSSCGKRGPLFIAVRRPLTIAASLVAEHRLQTHRLSNCGSRAQLLRSMWDLPRPGLEPVCPLHWQADSQPLCHQGSPPAGSFFNYKFNFTTSDWSFQVVFFFLIQSWHSVRF